MITTTGTEYFIQSRTQRVLNTKKKKLVGSLGANVVRGGNTTASLEDVKVVVPLKNLSNFMFNLDFLMISSEIDLILIGVKIVY